MPSDPIEISPPQVLYRDRRFYSSFPALARDAQGGLLLTFRRAPDHRWLTPLDATDARRDAVDHLHFKSHIAALRLGPDLWPSEPVAMLCPHAEAADQDTALLRLADGRLIHLGFLWLPVGGVDPALPDGVFRCTAGDAPAPVYMLWHAYARYSDDDGKTWSDHTPFARDPLTDARIPDAVPGTAALRGQALERDDGVLLAAAYAGALDWPGGRRAVRIYASADRGATWQPRGEPLAGDGWVMTESSLVAWPHGAISLFSRTEGADDRIAFARSDDGGASFTRPRLLSIHGHPPVAQPLADGRLLLVYGYRHAPFGVRARLIAPDDLATDGTAGDTAELILRDDAPGPDTGYPWIVPTPAGDLAVVYYIADDAGIRGIEGQVLRGLTPAP